VAAAHHSPSGEEPVPMQRLSDKIGRRKRADLQSV
jgi:hypothetical protein